MTIDCTILVAVDREHLAELQIAWPTWATLKPELRDWLMLVMVDGSLRFGGGEWLAEAVWSIIGHRPNTTIRAWDWGIELPQRERMLTALVRAAEWIETPWFLKADTDCLATSAGRWFEPWWLSGDPAPAFIASPWGYSKPADAIQRLDDWGDCTTGIREFRRLALPYDPQARLVKHKRIISWLMFGRTEWARRMSALAPDRLPVPSQDGFLWYCAARRGDFYRTIRMSQFGWSHVSGGGIEKLRRVAGEVLAKAA